MAKSKTMHELTIDGKPVAAAHGATVLEAAASAGIEIPTLCYHPDLSIDGNCRLCVVEVEGMAGQPAACGLAAADGMVVRTASDAVVASRRMVLEMLLANYSPAGDGCTKPNEFQRWVREYGVQSSGERPAEPRFARDADPNPFIRVDFNECILCTRCVRACSEVQGRFVWSVAERGYESRIVAGLDTTMLEGRCESCGACVTYCPTGALADRGALGGGAAEKQVATTCGYCGVGCQFDLNVRKGRIVGVTANAEAPVNGLSLCVKGRYGYDFVHHADRLVRPSVRRWLLDGSAKPPSGSGPSPWVEVEWNEALAIVAGRLAETLRRHGPHALGFLSSAKCTNEENYLVQKMARQLAGTHNVDHCARLCHSSTVAGLAMCYGSGAMSNSMDDVAGQAAAMLVIGSNVTEQHPVFGAMIRQAVLRRGMKLVVADPRRIDITEFATLHLRQTPGSDIALLNGLMNIILERGWHDRRFIAERCEGFEEFRGVVRQYTPERVAARTGVSLADLERAAEILGTNHPLAAVWAMGITQHTTGVLNVLCLGNLQMLLGNMGVPGGGVNPLRGQNNVQGACDMGALPNVYPGYQGVASGEARAKFAAAWKLRDEGESPLAASASDANERLAGAPPLDAPPGLTVTELLEAGREGRLRSLFILGEDPAMTEPDSNHARACLAATEFIVLEEIFPSETAAYADVLLPAASFAEKSGTFTNTERRVQLVRPAVDPPGEARPDWAILGELARRLLTELKVAPAGAHAGWDYASPAAIMEEIAALSPSYAGVRHERLEGGERLQWPVLDTNHPGTPILHVGRFTRGLGKFHAVDDLPAAELPDDDYPLLLTTGRVLYHWHGGELTRRSEPLLQACPEAVVEISPDDAARLQLHGRSWVRVRSRRGQIVSRAVVTDRVAAGVVFGNFHFPGDRNVNNLTIGALDPVAKIPEYKVCAVAVEAIEVNSSPFA
jgi:formate dehydrogenase alpha subunit